MGDIQIKQVSQQVKTNLRRNNFPFRMLKQPVASLEEGSLQNRQGQSILPEGRRAGYGSGEAMLFVPLSHMCQGSIVRQCIM